MRKTLTLLTALVLVLILGVSIASANHDSVDWDYQVYLTELNESGVSGEARIKFEANTVTVYVNATGLVDEVDGEAVPHAQHIHGLDAKNEVGTCPPPAADTNNDGDISVGEGVPFYGGVLVPLTPFPTTDGNGEVTYLQFDLEARARDVQPLEKRVVVLHGGYNEAGEYVPSLPVACGTVMAYES